MIGPRDISIKRITDDLYNIFFTELHPPYMNYMGPKTKIEDRISLNYDVRPISKGTKNYMIPTSESDYHSFIHDLLYYSPNDRVKFNADKKYISEVKSPVGLLGIGAQFLKRGVLNIGELGFNLKLIYKTMTELAEQIDPAIRQGGAINIAKKIGLPIYIFHNYLYPRAYESATKSLDNFVNQFISKKEFKVVLDEANKVQKKLDKYLDLVGQYEPLSSETSEKYFVVDKNIDTEKSKKAYEEFYKQVVEYFDFMNNKYKDTPGYKQVEIPPLNMDRIEDASNPEQVSRTIDEMITKTIEGATEEMKEFFNKYSKEDIEKIKEEQTKEEIEKVLKREIEVPFETPTIMPSEEPEKEYIEGDDETIIVMPDDIKKEIEAILQKRQEKPFETPSEFIEPTPSEIKEPTPSEIIEAISKGSVIKSPPQLEEEPEFMKYDFEAINNIVEVEVKPTQRPDYDLLYEMGAI